MSKVLIVGAGPVGLTLAAELARHGVRPRLVERRAEPLPYCRAIGVTPRSLEVFEDMGVARELIDAGLWLRGLRSEIEGRPPFDVLNDFPELPYGELGVPQYETERLLARHLGRYGVAAERGVALTALVQDEAGVTATLEGPAGREEARFDYLVGCDGAHSSVRHALGIAFEGDAFPITFMLGDVLIEGLDLPRGLALRAMRLREDRPPDMFIAIPLPEPNRYRVSMLAPEAMWEAAGNEHGIQFEQGGPSLSDIQAVADGLMPGRTRLSDLRWSSTFRISMRLAARYRRERVFLAGDAAHIHPPTGGQGMNTGIQDAYNLAWKLALVLQGTSPAALLDSYEAERRPVGAEVIERTRAASLGFGRERGKPDRLENTQIRVTYRGADWLADDAPSLAEAVPAPGDRAPDAQGLRRLNLGFPLRLFDILRGTEHLLLLHRQDLSDAALATVRALAAPLEGRLRIAAVAAAGEAGQDPFGIPLYEDAAGGFAAAYGEQPAVFLIRPDGHLAWRGPDAGHPGLAAFLNRLFRTEG